MEGAPDKMLQAAVPANVDVRIEAVMAEGQYRTKSAFVRAAVLQLLRTEEAQVEANRVPTPA